jgi:hypothetical protein
MKACASQQARKICKREAAACQVDKKCVLLHAAAADVAQEGMPKSMALM